MLRPLIGVALALLLGCGASRAPKPLTPVRFIGKGQPGPLARRLAVELDAVKIHAILLEGFGLPDTELARLARQHAARAGVLVQHGAGRAQRLVIFVISDGGTMRRQVVVPGASETPGELVLRVVETLRAELLPLPDLPAAPRAKKAAGKKTPVATSRPASSPVTVASVSRPRASRTIAPSKVAKGSPRAGGGQLASAPPPLRAFSVGVSGGVTYGPGGLDPFAQVGLAFGWRFAAQWELRSKLLLPAGVGRIEAVGGSSDLYPTLASVGVDWLPLAPRGRFALHLGLRAGAALLYASGRAIAPFIAQGEAAWAAHLSADGGLSLTLHPRWALRLDLLLGTWIPRPQIVIGDEVAASWGRPFFHAGLGIEAKL